MTAGFLTGAMAVGTAKVGGRTEWMAGHRIATLFGFTVWLVLPKPVSRVKLTARSKEIFVWKRDMP